MERFLLVLIGLTVGVCSHAADEQWLMYRTSPEMSRIVGLGSRMTGAKATTDAPEGVSLPKLNHDHPVFAKWKTPMAATGHVWLAFDREGKYGQLNRLYADRDCDGDLADEEPIKPSNTSSYSTEFGPVPILFTTADGLVTYHLGVQLYTYDETPRVYLSSKAWYEGKVTIGNKEWRCLLMDYNGNGTFNDTGSELGSLDRVRLAPVGKDELETYFAGELVQLEGAYYHPTVAQDGAFISFEPAGNVATGTVRLSGKVNTFSAAGPKGLFHFQPNDSGVVTLPTGRYRSYDWIIERKDDKGALWKADAGTASGWFVVREDAETELSVGEPLVSSLGVTKTGGQFRFSQSLRGQLKESVSLTKNGSRSAAPKLRVVSATGDYDKTLTFEYG